MQIQSAFNSGLEGFARAENQVNQSANNIATAVVKTEASTQAPVAQAEQRDPINQELVNLKVAEHEAQASSKVIQTADDVLGTLIDISA